MSNKTCLSMVNFRMFTIYRNDLKRNLNDSSSHVISKKIQVTATGNADWSICDTTAS